MTQTVSSDRYVTVAHFAKVSEDCALQLCVHVLPENEDGSGSSDGTRPTSIGLPPPFSWLEERHMQELMVMVHEVAYAKATQGLGRDGFEPSTSNKPKFQLRRGRSLRALLNFKSHSRIQHVILPTDTELCSQLTPSVATYVTNYGRRVFQSDGLTTTAGSGCKPLRVLPDSLHVFIDSYEPTSSNGVVKIFTLLDPSHKQSLDILAYFQPQHKRDYSHSDDEGGGGMLAELPVAGLKRQRGRAGATGRGQGKRKTAKGKSRGGKTSSRSAQKKGSLSVGSKEHLSQQEQQQTISESLACVRDRAAQPHVLQPASYNGSHQTPDELVVSDSITCNSEEASSLGEYTAECTERSAASDVDDKDILYLTPPLDGLNGEDEEEEEEEEEVQWLQSIPAPEVFPSTSVCNLGSGSVSSPAWADCSDRTLTFVQQSQSPLPVQDDKLLMNNTQSSHSVSPLCKQLVCASGGAGSETLEDILTCSLVDKFDSSKVRKETNKEGNRERRSGGCQCDLAEVGMEVTALVTPPRQRSNEPVPFGDMTNCFQNNLHPRHQSLLVEAGRSAMATVNGAAYTSRVSQHALSLEQAPTNVPNASQLQDALVDIIINDDSAVVSSGEDSVSPPSSQENKTTGKRKRKVFSVSTLFRGAKELREIPVRGLRRWLYQQKQLLLDIFQRNIYSKRHEDFTKGPGKRAALQYQISTHLLTQEQVEVITEGLMKAFCHQNMKYFSYVMSVLFPECIIRLIMDFHSISFEKAERLMFNHEQKD